MTVKKTMRILLAGVLLCTLLSGCEKRSETPKETFSFDNSELTEYVPDAAIQDARLRLQNDTGKCTVLTGVEAQQRKVSLVFLGMADPAQVILKTVLGSTPKYCAANATRLTDNVLHAAWCAGLKKAI